MDRTSLFLETSTKLGPALRLYETSGFEYQETRKPDSHYARADVYMVWREPTTAGASKSEKPRKRVGSKPEPKSRKATRKIST